MVKKRKGYGNAWIVLVFIVLVCAAAIWFKGYWYDGGENISGTEHGPDALVKNYGKEIKKYSKEFNLPPTYIAALCMLESSGRKPVAGRFEKHVYARLKLVKLGVKSNYEHVTTEDLHDATDEAIRNLSTSWGPFQLMGYKCLMYDIKVRDLRGNDGMYWALKWIDESYGKMLRKGDFQNAFHYHNSGRVIPKNRKHFTHDKNYVKKGLEWMNYFEPVFNGEL